MNEAEVRKIVENVLLHMEENSQPETKLKGVFPTMEEALEAVQTAYKQFRGYTVEQRENMINSIRRATLEHAQDLAEMGVKETGMGRVTDKIIKHQLVAEKTPGTEALRTEAYSGDRGLTLVELGPYGIIGAITPSTNPSETVLCNSMGMIAAGNGVVFNPHPGAVNTSNYAVDLVNKAILEAGGPENLVCSVEKPTMKTSEIMMKSPAVKMLVATGGPGVVRALLSSGKKAIGAGAGNPPVIVDETADIQKAAKDIVDGASFDNNLPCIAEKECFAVAEVADELIHYMTQNGAYLISGSQIDQLLSFAMVQKDGKYVINKKWVGKDAALFLKELGIQSDAKLILCETPFMHPFVQEELMMPILPLVRVKDFDEAVEKAVAAENGRRHSAHIHSKNVDHLTRFAREVETTIFVKNAPSYAGIGAGGEGYTTFTIAGPTGEGLTCARSFARQRRCVMVDSFSII